MLRHVVVENYVIFKGRHELDLSGKDGCNFFTFVGENASGKSSLVALIKAACNLQEEGPDFEVLNNDLGLSKAVCQFEMSKDEIRKLCDNCSTIATQPARLSAGLSSWFCDDLIKIPEPLVDMIRHICLKSTTAKFQVLVGHRHNPVRAKFSKPFDDVDADWLCNSQFMYIIMNNEIFVVTKSAGSLITGFHEPLPGGVNPMDWIPQHSFLINVKTIPYVSDGVSRSTSSSSLDSTLQSYYDNMVTSQYSKDATMATNDVSLATDNQTQQVNEVDGSMMSALQNDVIKEKSTFDHRCSPSSSPKVSRRHVLKRLSSFGGLAWSNYHELKKMIVTDLLRGFPKESLKDIHPLFHEIVGTKSLSFDLNVRSSSKESFQVTDSKTGRPMRRIPEGVFSAFIIAALVVNPHSRNIILDEPSRGMHPVQIRRLRNILMRESVKRRKCIIAVSHSPELIDVDRITLILRFQLLPSGYCQIRRVTSRYTERELLFIGGAEIREIFFSRHIIWVEGESDKRFIEALLGLFDDGNCDLWKALNAERSHKTLAVHEDTDGEESRSRSPSPGPFSHYKSYIETAFQDAAYQRQYYTEEQLGHVQEAVRSCKVLSIGGKKNIWKSAAICRDLRIPFAVICDLDAIIPNSRENSVLSQFEKCEGDWNVANIPFAKTKLLDDEESPASKAIEDTDKERITKLKSLRHVGDVMRFYDKEMYFFTWWLMGGEIEDAVRLTRTHFGKKLWPDLLNAELKELIVTLLDPRKLLLKDPKSREASKGPNLEILRCIYFLIKFFKETLNDMK